MKSKTMLFSAALLLLVAVTAQSQDTAKAAYEWKTSGETVADFKAEFVLNAKVDQSTPEGAVNAYALLTDNRSENAKLAQDFYLKGAAIVRNEAKALFEKLLSEEMMKVRADAEKSAEKTEESTYKSEATTITATTDGKDGAKLVETLQKASYMSEVYDPETGAPTGKQEETKYETKRRYTCVKGEGGTWRIDMVEEFAMNWDKMDENGVAPEEWQATSHALAWYLNQSEQPKAEELKQDTPENAALSLFHSVIQTRDNWNMEIYSRGQKGWIDAVRPLFTEKGLKGPEGSGEKYEMSSEKREVDKVSDGTDGVKKVKFKARSEWSGAIEIHVKKVGEVWKIVNAGYYEIAWTDMGEPTEGEFTENKDLETLGWH